jgi:hypothetical protein
MRSMEVSTARCKLECNDFVIFSDDRGSRAAPPVTVVERHERTVEPQDDEFARIWVSRVAALAQPVYGITLSMV